MGAIELKSASGSVTLVPEDGAGNVEVVVPRGGVGKVLQVVSLTKTDSNVYSSVGFGFIDVTNNGLNITPSSTSSKILIHIMVNGSATVDGMLRIVRNSTAIGVGTGGDNGTAFISDRGTGAYEGFSSNMTYLDSPGSTSPVLYKWQIAGSGSTTWYVNRPPSSATSERTVCTITLMEIGA